MTDEWLTIAEAADELGVSERTIRRLCKARKLPSSKTAGGHHRLRRSDLEEYRAKLPSTPTAGGPSPALKNRKERVDELALELQERRLKRDVKRLRDEEAQEEADRKAAAEEERRHQEEEGARAKRDQAERDRQEDLRAWRAQVMHIFSDYIPKEAPRALVAKFYEKVDAGLAQFACQQLTPVVEALGAAAAEEVFAPWAAERQAQARAAWIEQQTNQAWDRLSWRCRLEDLTVPDDSPEELRTALHGAIIGTMRGLGPDSSWGALDQARERAGGVVLAPYRKKKRLGLPCFAHGRLNCPRCVGQDDQSEAMPAATSPRAPSPAALTQSAIAAAMQVVRPHLQKRHQQGLLPASLDAQDVDLLVRLAEDKVRAYLESEGRKRELTTDEAVQLARDFIDTDYRLI